MRILPSRRATTLLCSPSTTWLCDLLIRPTYCIYTTTTSPSGLTILSFYNPISSLIATNILNYSRTLPIAPQSQKHSTKVYWN